MRPPNSAARVLLVSDPAPIASGGEATPNWSHGFLAFLEKRFPHVTTTATLDLAEAGAADLVVVGPRQDAEVGPVDWEGLQRLGTPVLIEASAFSAHTRAMEGLAERAVPKEAEISYREPAVRTALKPFANFLGGAADRHPIAPAKVRERYVPPDPRRFAIDSPTIEWPDIAANVGLRQVFAWRHRWLAGNVDLAAETAQLGAIALAVAAFRLEPGAHRDALRADAAQLAESLKGNSPAADLLAGWLAAPTGAPQDGVEVLRPILGRLDGLPPIRDARALVEGDEAMAAMRAAQHPSVVVALAVAGILAAKNRHEAAELLARISAERLDRDKSAFFNADAENGTRTYANHPLLTLILLCLAPRLTLEDWTDPGEDGPNAAALRWWSLRPRVPMLIPDTAPERLLAEIATTETGFPALPAVWQSGDAIVLGFPILTLIGHAQTLPPLRMPLEDGNHHWALLVEHALGAILAARSETLARYLRRTERPFVVVRHDVDRPVDMETFRRLLKAHGERGVKSSWYWIHDRLNPAQMSALVDAGHEVALHGLRTREKREERERVENALDLSVVGETYHGAGADYHIGAASAVAATRAGFLYSELSPVGYDPSSTAFVTVDETGYVRFQRGTANITFAYTTDTGDTTRKRSVAAEPAFALGLLRAGYSVSVLNHPDMNAGRLSAFLDSAEKIGVCYATARDLAWSAVRRTTDGVAGDGRTAPPALASIADLGRVSCRDPSFAFRPKGVFIIGAPRTGSTLLNNLLATLPDAMPALPEVTPFISIVEAFVKSRRLDAVHEGAFFGDGNAVENAFGTFLEQIVDSLLDRYGGELAILKSPYLTHYFPELAGLFPDFVFLCTLRHPALIVRSMRAWGEKSATDGQEHVYASADDTELYRLIREYYGPVLRLRDAETARRLRFIRFEDLISGSERCIADVLRLCGREDGTLDFDEPYARSTVSYETAEGSMRHAMTQLYGKAVDRDKPRRDRESLSEAENRAAAAEFSAYMSAFYPEFVQPPTKAARAAQRSSSLSLRNVGAPRASGTSTKPPLRR